MNDIGLHHQIVVNEIGRIGVVGVDAADPGRGEIHLIRPFIGKERLDIRLPGQVQFGMGPGENPLGGMTRIQQLPDDGRADHAAMAGHVNFGCFLHRGCGGVS